MSSIQKRMQAIRRKITEKQVPDNHIIEVNAIDGETEPEALKKYLRTNDTQQDDHFMYIHLVGEKQIKERMAKEAKLG